ncbi:hypothetical protein [Kitasatospora aureofaciens]|uniref:hypothetical protein n=1 Tax=Kitasatospora aureofaciens TaxID=1894 RepID=UPI0034026104
MNITLKDVFKVVARFKGEAHYSKACFMLEMAFHMEGPRAAMAHARRIAAAYVNLRNSRTEARNSALRADAERRGLRVA